MNAARAVVAARRVVAAAPLSSPLRAQAVGRRMMSSGDKHDHRVFNPPYNPWGTPFTITAFAVIGGIAVSAVAVGLQQYKWTPSK